MRRVVYVVMDGVGVGALPDAADYGDEGSDTLGNLARAVPLDLPVMQRLGLGNITPLVGVPPVAEPQALLGRLAPSSIGKDSTVGHWEHMGVVTSSPFPTFPEGFPKEIIEEFERLIGRNVLGNRPASGTQIIAELGAEHVATGRPIVYTSADSVFQVAAHTDAVPLEALYQWCQTARDLLTGPYAVARVIARPFRGEPGCYERTADRKDYSLPPPSPTYLDLLSDADQEVIALGKIGQIFAERGITKSLKVRSNTENLALLAALVEGNSVAAVCNSGLLITNLVDFDTTWGHRNDVVGFAQGLREADRAIGRLLELLCPDDLLVITADHGVDPTTVSTDHSREYVPLLVYPRPPEASQRVYEGNYADTGASAYRYLVGEAPSLHGRPVWDEHPSRGWRRYTPARRPSPGASDVVPGRVGPEEAALAAAWLRDSVGPAPGLAVVLGSGLSGCLAGLGIEAEIPCADVPHWPSGSVTGHPQRLRVLLLGGVRCVCLCGRVHEYEAFDLSEVQLPLRTLVAWGVRSAILTTAAGAVDSTLTSGQPVVCTEVIDLSHRASHERPDTLLATRPELVRRLRDECPPSISLRPGVHACVPGPQYETEAEIQWLRSIGVNTVSMSSAAELMVAHDENIHVVVLPVVSNVGETTHAQVLAESERCADSLRVVLGTVAQLLA